MATKSILKNITIKDNGSARRLANALEHSNERRDNPVEFSRSVSEASRDEIRYMFGKEQQNN